MQVHFGWGYDGARWNHKDSLRYYTAGSTGLTSLLATRLGLTIPAAPQVQRVAVYRRALEKHVTESDDVLNAPWFADSFAKDPWATARQVLAWRDELVGAGWYAEEHADESMPARLSTMARIETALAREPDWTPGSTYLLADVAAELQWLNSAQLPYDLGIETITERYRILAVDEFQDTSPLQLALFTELGGLVEEVIWVGDPKQSIYRFRGADPDLMQAAITVIEDGGGTTDTLNYSWRTHQVPLDVTNRIFSQLFAGIDPVTCRNPEVWLDVAPPRTQAHVGGQVQLWVDADTDKPNNDQWYRRIVHGLLDQESSEANIGSRAILTRTNSQAAELQRLLAAHGIPVTGGGAPLLDTREGAAVRAGIAFLLDRTTPRRWSSSSCCSTNTRPTRPGSNSCQRSRLEPSGVSSLPSGARILL